MSTLEEKLENSSFKKLKIEMSIDIQPIFYYSVIDNTEIITPNKIIPPFKTNIFDSKELSLFLYLINSDEVMNKLDSFLSDNGEPIEKYAFPKRSSLSDMDTILFLIANTVVNMQFFIRDQISKHEKEIEILSKSLETTHDTGLIEFATKRREKVSSKLNIYKNIDFTNDIFLSYIQEVMIKIDLARFLIKKLINITDTNKKLECLNAHRNNFSIPSSDITYLIKENDKYTTKMKLRTKEELSHLPELIEIRDKIKNRDEDHFEEIHSAVQKLVNIGENYEKNKKYHYEVMQQYKIYNIDDFINLSLYLIYKDNITILKCKNCGKYFIQKTRSSETLCDNIYKNGKTCKQLSSVIKLENDEISKIYRNAYKLENGRLHRLGKNNEVFKNKFFVWNEKAREMMKKCQTGKITLEEYKQWIKDNKEWYRKEVK